MKISVRRDRLLNFTNITGITSRRLVSCNLRYSRVTKLPDPIKKRVNKLRGAAENLMR
jgi:hypothetical protein